MAIADRLAAIETRLSESARKSDWPEAERAAKNFSRMSPTSLHIALRQMRYGGGQDFAECMNMEYRIVSRVLDGDDFYEGVRAQIVDKDRNPVWKPGELSDVDSADIDCYFAPMDEIPELLSGMTDKSSRE